VAASHQLLCPCHQSTFDVLRGAKPIFGPAAVSLPQLPLAVDELGFIRAAGGFSSPPGPSFWNRSI
jgi:ubiquinol-cytochrome c reductase iron-sulfur subunit